MNLLLCFLANFFWVVSCLIDAVLFKFSICHVEKVQRNLLKVLLRKNMETIYGRRYHFSLINDIEAYKKYVPLVTYDEITGEIEKIKNGEKAVLTTEDVIMLETTSGSTAPSKYIPYTKELKKQFVVGIGPWIVHIYLESPSIFFGSAYWSISPINQQEKYTPAGIPIGFEADNEYFGFFGQLFLKTIFAVPHEVKNIGDIDDFRYVTMLFLLKARRLSLISIWNPSFLTLLIETLGIHFDDLLEDLKNGTINPKIKITEALRTRLEKMLKKNPNRAQEIETIRQQPIGDKSIYEKIWPKLKVISCWKDASANRYAMELNSLFPNVSMQGKGLLATEGLVSIPYIRNRNGVAAIRSHFIELEEMDEKGRFTAQTILLHEAKVGKRYGVVITTAGGLYRYRLLDIIEVTGYIKQCPTMKFIGKARGTSDLVGEKLNEIHVMHVTEGVLSRYQLETSFYMVAPSIENYGPPGYVLYLETSIGIAEENLKNVMEEIEKGLCQNFHYNYCRELGQLRGLRIFLIKHSGMSIYNNTLRELGMREGNIKPQALNKELGWDARFQGHFIKY